MKTTDPSDLITVIATILAMITSPETAQILAPYAGIVIAAIAGAGLSLSGKMEDMGAMKSIRYISIRVLTATSLAVLLAFCLQAIFLQIPARAAVIPIAFLIGWIRDMAHAKRIIKFVRFARDETGDKRGT